MQEQPLGRFRDLRLDRADPRATEQTVARAIGTFDTAFATKQSSEASASLMFSCDMLSDLRVPVPIRNAYSLNDAVRMRINCKELLELSDVHHYS